MRSFDLNDEDEFLNNNTDEMLEEDMDVVIINFQCEDCDYRWREKRKPHLTDEDKTGTFIEIDDDVQCPICGSNNVSIIDV